MEIELKGMQRLLLWQLAVSRETLFLKDIKLSVTATDRKALEREGLTREEKQLNPTSGRQATCVSLEDKGWAWCQQHLRTPIGTKSNYATPILEDLLALLANYLDAHQDTHSFGQFIMQASRKPTGDLVAGESPGEPDDQTADQPSGEPTKNVSASELPAAVRAACLETTGGQRNVRVRLADLRTRVPTDRSRLDETLLAMERAGELSLFPLDNPREIGPRDTDALLYTPAGHPRHIVYYQGTPT